eukprot:6210722-Pleurochrysis_carterae.AAC.1
MRPQARSHHYTHVHTTTRTFTPPPRLHCAKPQVSVAKADFAAMDKILGRVRPELEMQSGIEKASPARETHSPVFQFRQKRISKDNLRLDARDDPPAFCHATSAG